MASHTIKQLQRLVGQCNKRIERYGRQEAQKRRVWYRAYEQFMTATEKIAELSHYGTKKEQGLKSRIRGWRQRSQELTKKRNEARNTIKREMQKKGVYQIELARLNEQIEAEVRQTNEIVNQVFFLSDGVKRAWDALGEYLAGHVYSSLIVDGGKLRSQITFTHSDGMRKVTAMVNTITKVQPDMAAQAKSLIEQFFGRILPQGKLEETTKALYDLTRGLLIEKTQFKIGPDLYRFLGLELNREVFPELKTAQDILRRSLRSEKTNSYIRLFQKEDRHSNWVRIRRT